MRMIRNIICLILIIVGIFCGIKLGQEITKKNYVNGSAAIHNEFRKEAFFYSNSAVPFMPGENGDYYYFNAKLSPVDGIDLTKNDYTFYFMGKPVLDIDMEGGLIIAPISMNFYNVDGSLACTGTLTCRVEFLSNETWVKLYAINKTSADYFEQTFYDYGLSLKLVQNLGDK